MTPEDIEKNKNSVEWNRKRAKKNRSASEEVLTERIKLNRVVTISFSWILPAKASEICWRLSGKIAKKGSQKCSYLLWPDYVRHENDRSNFIKSAYLLLSHRAYTIYTRICNRQRDLETDFNCTLERTTWKFLCQTMLDSC